MMDLGGLAKALALTAVAVEHSGPDRMERVCKLLVKSAKHAIGTYKFGWPQLAPSTQADRVREGWPANEPLLRTGELQDSITYNMDHDGREAFVGSDNEKAVWQEFGTAKIPPRSFLGGALYANEEKIKKIVISSALTAFVATWKQINVEADAELD